MTITANMYVRLWNGEAGKVLSVIGSTVNVLLASGVRKCVEATQVVEAESNEKFELAQKRLQAFNKKQATKGATSREELIKKIKGITGDSFVIKTTEEFNPEGRKDGLWIGAEDPIKDGLPIADHDEGYINADLKKVLDESNWVMEWYDPGTIMLYPEVEDDWNLDKREAAVVDNRFGMRRSSDASFDAVFASVEKQAPGKVDEPKWKKAEEAVAKSRNKSKSDFTDRDWGLVNHIYQNQGGTFKSKSSVEKMSSYEEWSKELDDAGESVPMTKAEFDSYVKNTGKVPSVADALAWKGVEASKKTAGHPQDLVDAEAKYHLGDILIPAENYDEGDIGQAMHILDIKPEDKVYVVEKRPNVDDKDRDKSETFGVRYEIPISTLDKDKSWVKFAIKSPVKTQEDYGDIPFKASEKKAAIVDDPGVIEDIQDDDRWILVDLDTDIQAIKEMYGEEAEEYDGFFVLMGDGDYDAVYGFNGSTPYLYKNLYKVASKTSSLDVKSIKTANGSTIFMLTNGSISFDAEGKATSTVAGVTDSQIAEFGKMVKTFGAEKLASMVAIKRLNQKKVALSKKDDISEGTDKTKDALQKNALFEVKEMPGNEGVKAQGGPIEVKQKGTRFTPKTLRDHAFLRQLIGTPYFAEKDYDKVLEIASKAGYGITIYDYDDITAAKKTAKDNRHWTKKLMWKTKEEEDAYKKKEKDDNWKAAVEQDEDSIILRDEKRGITSAMARLKKKAARLGQWDFDKHDPIWKLEAGDDGKKKLVRTIK